MLLEVDPSVKRFIDLHSDGDRAVREKVAPFRRMSLEERGDWVNAALGNLSMFLEMRPDRREEILAREDPRSAESLALWRRLIAEARGARDAHR